MFKHYRDLCDVVSLLVYCPSERAFLLTKETSGEYWIPSCKTEKNSWKMTAQKMNLELLGNDASPCLPLRVNKIWLPNHHTNCVFHAVFRVPIKGDVKKQTKMKVGVRNRLQWFNAVELERLRAHAALRSPEVAMFAAMAMGDQCKDFESQEMECGVLIEVCEENTLLGAECAGGAVGLASPNYQLLQAANYNKDDQIRMYREFTQMVYPSLYMGAHLFSQFMMDLGWQRPQCASLFRAADVCGRGGLSYLELLLWMAALEPATQHSGVTAEVRCRYIFRYFDTNRDTKLEYVEFKELVAAARAARQLPVDALSVARDADSCLRQLGIQANAQLPIEEFLRGVGEQRLRGTSSLLRAPRSISSYLVDLQERENEKVVTSISLPKAAAQTSNSSGVAPRLSERESAPRGASGTRRAAAAPCDYSVAAYTVRLRRRAPNELLELRHFDEEAVSASTAKLITGPARSLEVLGPAAVPVEALAAVRYFAMPIEKSPHGRPSVSHQLAGKPAMAWATQNEELSMGNLLIKLADAVRPICASEPRLLRVNSPVYVVGDLHGNLAALMSIEAALWPTGTALAPTHFLFLGDYVDRGPHGCEVLAYLMAAKIQRPHAVLMVRGNHETRDIQKMFTFYTECINKYGETDGGRVWAAVNQVFDALPLAAVVDDKVFCCHGGIPPPWVCPLISAIDKVPVPLPKPAEQSSIAWELLWNDPVNCLNVEPQHPCSSDPTRPQQRWR
ncbi:uncharacterized protein isoform X3 [Choristoneura fumiferana]|uniref:uncharacterized protein isoform X3 n=1 Tax=Choristoneura fumiferana TaxID=7141 RepID=UPI003D15918A